jgi:(2Fe-2S) ferredoxin
MSEQVTEAQERRYPRMKICVNYRAGDLLPSCGSKGSKELAEALKAEIAQRGDFIALETVHCLGKCHIGPTLKLLPSGPFLLGAQAQDAPDIVALLHAESYEDLAQKFPNPDSFETP